MSTKTDYPKVTLKPGRDASLRRYHPWVFSGAVERKEGNPAPGQLVELHTSRGEYLATGFYFDSSIAVKVVSFERLAVDDDFWSKKFRAAIELRQQLGLFSDSDTNSFRLIHGEGDGIPGLIADLYHDSIVLQFHHVGLRAFSALFSRILCECLGSRVKRVYLKNAEEGADSGTYLWGDQVTGEALESGVRYGIDWEKGQKTGFFLDQRENRLLLRRYSQGRTVLNTFCYTGGFSLNALAGGATEVVSIDSSTAAISQLIANLDLNGVTGKHQAIEGDCFDYLTELDRQFDLIVLDPPAFAKHRRAIDSGLKGYRRINALALRNINPNGLLFTFSCSQLVTRDNFRDAVSAAAVEARREVRVLHELHQAPCHPVSIFHPEGEYLKGFVLHVR